MRVRRVIARVVAIAAMTITVIVMQMSVRFRVRNRNEFFTVFKEVIVAVVSMSRGLLLFRRAPLAPHSFPEKVKETKPPKRLKS